MKPTSDFTDALLQVSRRFGMLERDAVCCGDVTVRQCFALQILQGEPLDVGTIAERMGVTPGATTRLIDGMMDRGWVDRRRDPNDRRRVLLELTEEGRQEAEHLRDQTEQIVESVVSEVPADQREKVFEAIDLLADAFVEADVDISCCRPSDR